MRFVSRGEEEAFRVLFRRHTPRVYAVAMRLLRGRVADAEDVVQETWLRASRRLGTFEWQSSLTTWLIGIAVNCVRERWRAQPPSDEDSSQLPDAEALPSRHVPDAIDLERAIAALPNRQRLVLVLHDVEGWTHGEIAAQLGIEAGTSKSTLFHARRHVRARLRAPSGSLP